METESRPIVGREEKLRKVEEKLLSNKTNERFTNYDGVMSDNNLSLPQKIIRLQKAIDDATRRKILWASFQGELFEKCYYQSKRIIKNLWRKRSLQDGGCYFYESYTNSFSTTMNFNFALFL